MKVKTKRLETIKMLISSMELSSQEEVIKALQKEGYKLTQATLSRDLKQLKVAKAASMGGKYVYVLPNDSMYKRVSTPGKASEMLLRSGYLSIHFSGQMAIIKTRPGYASAIAYNLDNSDLPEILGTIAGDDTIFVVFKEGCSHEEVQKSISNVIPELQASPLYRKEIETLWRIRQLWRVSPSHNKIPNNILLSRYLPLHSSRYIAE
mgnify:CR=1 FL=1